MDDQTLFDRQYASLRGFCEILGRAAPDSQVFERDGVLAAVVPAAPERAVVNRWRTRTPAGWSGRCRSWRRRMRRRACGPGPSGYRTTTPRRPALWPRAGHVLDAEPEAMAMELSALEAPRPADLDLDPEAGPATVARINDLAYTFGGDHFERSCAPLRHCTATSRGATGARCAARRATTTTATSR